MSRKKLARMRQGWVLPNEAVTDFMEEATQMTIVNHPAKVEMGMRATQGEGSCSRFGWKE